ncbi:hypothetical protein DERP_001531 [Dermatophagoides pteronyssinus]|uniref:Uncharacterized protein n=1 Tax=Dermatophagoides pteronyssinus TaxID=6956 RepID=A0ABQ8JAT0_DERPT|nr:hypothetical protein DERP_001531 [Dermatophagoides pteronyssinus]
MTYKLKNDLLQLYIHLEFIITSHFRVPFPPSHKITMAEAFDTKTNKPRIDVLKYHFVHEGRLEENASAIVILCDGEILGTT